jgi:hypothetical protein
VQVRDLGSWWGFESPTAHRSSPRGRLTSVVRLTGEAHTLNWGLTSATRATGGIHGHGAYRQTSVLNAAWRAADGQLASPTVELDASPVSPPDLSPPRNAIETRHATP